MNCLIVTTLPLKDSLCMTLTGFTKDEIVKAVHSVKIEDLYGSNFDPVLTEIERQSYYQTSYNSSKVTEQVKSYLK